MQRGTDRSRFERKRDLTFGACSSSTMKLPRDSPLNRLYFSYPFFFFFLRYTFLFARFEEKTRTFECI